MRDHQGDDLEGPESDARDERGSTTARTSAAVEESAYTPCGNPWFPHELLLPGRSSEWRLWAFRRAEPASGANPIRTRRSSCSSRGYPCLRPALFFVRPSGVCGPRRRRGPHGGSPGQSRTPWTPMSPVGAKSMAIRMLRARVDPLWPPRRRPGRDAVTAATTAASWRAGASGAQGGRLDERRGAGGRGDGLEHRADRVGRPDCLGLSGPGPNCSPVVREMDEIATIAEIARLVSTHSKRRSGERAPRRSTWSWSEPAPTRKKTPKPPPSRRRSTATAKWTAAAPVVHRAASETGHDAASARTGRGTRRQRPPLAPPHLPSPIPRSRAPLRRRTEGAQSETSTGAAPRSACSVDVASLLRFAREA